MHRAAAHAAAAAAARAASVAAGLTGVAPSAYAAFSDASRNPWMRDIAADSCLTALDDTDRENGCLWILPGSHRQGQIAVGEAGSAEAKKAMKEIDLHVDESKAVPVPMKAGECLIFGCWTLHKSEGNLSKDRDRRILFLRYADADAVEVYNGRKPRLGRLVRGTTRFEEVRTFESHLPL